MFSEGLIYPRRGPLALETRKRGQIDNELNWEPPYAGVLLQVADLKTTYPRAMHRNAGPCNTYNCHGLTFAARRTLISSPSEVRRILNEDGYKELEWRMVCAGDIAIYVNNTILNGVIEHSGLVVGRPSPVNGVYQEPEVLSKWGPCHEVVHPASYGPYDNCVITYYRIVD